MDLPIQRERHTGFPKIEGSGIKGCVREAFANSSKQVEIQGQKLNSAIEHILTWFLVQKNRDEHAAPSPLQTREFSSFLLSH